LRSATGEQQLLAHCTDADNTRSSFNLNQPVALERIAIAKPWGQELWYTGMEARGQSLVSANQGAGQIPLAQYLALAPQQLTAGATPVLLKILDPNPIDHLGDLYFELHAKKQEVYVVTHVDPNAWPDGVGAIRLGIDPQVRARYNNDNQLRTDYLTAVQDYEQIRRQIDEQTAIATPAQQAQEKQKRQHMESFTALRSLRVGDVVTVDPWYPHALQHGVRVVELQTPTYERMIISFAQQVVTQNHWDSAAAIAKMSLATPPAQPTSTPGQPPLIADYSDFKAWQITLAPDEQITLSQQPYYAVAIGIYGGVKVGALTIEAEAAALIPACALPTTLHNQSRHDAQVVVGAPPGFHLA